MVRLHRQYHGKGPTEAKTNLVDDTIICLLGCRFTPAEHSLRERSRGDIDPRTGSRWSDRDGESDGPIDFRELIR
jgi:uncharacterized protein YbcI